MLERNVVVNMNVGKRLKIEPLCWKDIVECTIAETFQVFYFTSEFMLEDT